ncbi:hypothetical protein QCA50_012428 [Cerrena zonata]|uniref:Uncharacterized protein n=1 Tax=Cerrena zonata TaxID=2478898 RepID=A0AAW0G479_9APHY
MTKKKATDSSASRPSKEPPRVAPNTGKAPPSRAVSEDSSNDLYQDAQKPEDEDLGNMTTAAVRGDSPLSELPEFEEEDQGSPSPPQRSSKPTTSTDNRAHGRSEVQSRLDEIVGPDFWDTDYGRVMSTLTDGVSDIQDDIDRINRKQVDSIQALIQMATMIEKGIVPKRGPSHDTRLRNAGLGDGPIDATPTPTSAIGQSASMVSSQRNREPPIEARGTRSPTPYGGPNPPSNYYLPDVDSSTGNKVIRFALDSDTMTDNQSDTEWIKSLIDEKLGQSVPELPILRQLKLEQPAKYSGGDDLESFDPWLSQVCRWMQLGRVAGPEHDHDRVMLLGQVLDDEALIWYNSVIDSPGRVNRHWEFETAVIALYTRFVNKSTVLSATEKFEAVRYTKSGGAARLANDLTRHSQRMVEKPDGYTLRRKFWDLLPEEITVNLGRARALSAESTPLNMLVKHSVQVEEAIRREQISKRIKAARQGSGPTGLPPMMATTSHNRPTTGRFNPKFRPGDRREIPKAGNSGQTGTSSMKPPVAPRASPPVQRTDHGKPNGPAGGCYRCGGDHYASDPKCPKNSEKPRPAVRRLAEILEGDNDDSGPHGEEGAPDDSPLEGSQYEPEGEFPEEEYEEYTEDEQPEAWMGGMRLARYHSADRAPGEVPRLNSMRTVMDFRGLPQGQRPHSDYSYVGPHYYSAEENRELVSVVDDVHEHVTQLRRRLAEAESENDAQLRVIDLWRRQAGDANIDIIELCAAVTDGRSRDEMSNLVTIVSRRQRARFYERKDTFSAIRYRDEDERSQSDHESDYDDMPALLSEYSEEEQPEVGSRTPWAIYTGSDDGDAHNVDAEERASSPSDQDRTQMINGPEIPLIQSERLNAIAAGRDREYRAAIAPKEVRPQRDFKCMTTYVEVNGLRGLALLDSGSSIDCVSPEFARIAKLKTIPLTKPVGLQLGCVGSRSTINFGTRNVVTIGEERDKVYLDVVNVDHYDLILGVPFLQQFGVSLDFRDETIHVRDQVIPSLQVGEEVRTAKPKRVYSGTTAKYK